MEDRLEQSPALTDEELRMMLDAKIRRNAGWALRDSVGSLGVQATDDEAVSNAVNSIYDNIISSFAYDENVVKATRAVKKFGKAYVRKVINAGLKDGSIKTEAEAAAAIDSLTEAETCPRTGKKKKRRYGEAVSAAVMARLDEEARLFWWGFYRERSNLDELNALEDELGLERTDREGWDEVAALDEKYVGFKKLVGMLKKKKGKGGKKVTDPKAVAAAIGREKYGKEKFQQMAAAGRKRAKKRMKKAA